MTRKIINKMSVLIIALPIMLIAQNKIGFVQSDRIRAEYEEFKDAEAQLQLEYRQVNTQYNMMVMELDSIKQAFETQRLMSSPELLSMKNLKMQKLSFSLNIDK